MTAFRVVIPARYGSTRYPGKVLELLNGKPLLQYVYESARNSGAEEVIVATDDDRVEAACKTFGADTAITSADHRSGTDRIIEVSEQRGWADDECVVNVQGDEPLMPSALIRDVAIALDDDPAAHIATACTSIVDADEFNDPNVVKVVRDQHNAALYFSRAPIPWDRDASTLGRAAIPGCGAWRHIGIYGYRVKSLKRFRSLPDSAIETTESLEQLRALTAGFRITVITADARPGPGVDTPDDLRAVAQWLSDNAD